jgi:hypothetical protein
MHQLPASHNAMRPSNDYNQHCGRVNALMTSFGGKKATTTLFWWEETQIALLPVPVEHPLYKLRYIKAMFESVYGSNKWGKAWINILKQQGLYAMIDWWPLFGA